MLKSVKNILFVILMVCPFVFYGQSKSGMFPTRSKSSVSYDAPIAKETYDAKYSYPYVTANFGPAFLNADNAKVKWGYEGNIGVGYKLIHIIGIEGNIGFASLDGKYEQLEVQNINCWEISLNVSVDMANLILGYDHQRRIHVEPHIGIGQIQHKGHIIYNNGNNFFIGHDNDAPNNMLGKGVHGRKIAMIVPYGIDASYEITNNLKVHLDVYTSFIDSDCLDGVERGLHYDWYSGVNVGVSYAWGKGGMGHKKLYDPCGTFRMRTNKHRKNK